VTGGRSLGAEKRGLPIEKGSAPQKSARAWEAGRAASHLGAGADTPAGRACGAALARVCAASSPSPWPPVSPSCRSRPCGEPSGSEERPGRARPGQGWLQQGGVVPSDLVPTYMVHEAVAHVQPPARFTTEPRPGIRRRLHLQSWAQNHLLFNRPNGRFPQGPPVAARTASGSETQLPVLNPDFRS
jgi:hypothetical protein